MLIANLKKSGILKWLSLEQLKNEISCDETSQAYLHNP
jgi:hypothetical protein